MALAAQQPTAGAGLQLHYIHVPLSKAKHAAVQVAAQIRKTLAPETTPVAHMLSTSRPPPGLGPDALGDNGRRSDSGSVGGSFDESTVDFSTCWICGEIAADFKAMPCLHVITCGWVGSACCFHSTGDYVGAWMLLLAS